MLNKLLKYEIKATARVFLPLFAAVLVMASVHRLFALIGGNNWKAPEIISITLYGILVVGMFVMTLIVMIQRFYKNLLSEEGYLMFTLPVRPWTHILAKLMISMLWTFLSVMAALLSIMVIASEELMKPRFWQVIGDGLAEVYSLPGTGLLTAEFLLLILIGTAVNILMIYAAIALGHLAGSHRVLASIGAYLGLNTAIQILFVLVSLIPGLAGFPFEQFNGRDFADIQPLMHYLMWYGIGLSALTGAGFYAVTHVVLTKHLNLE